MKIDIQKYWLEPPPEPSPMVAKWLEKIAAGWSPNKRIRSLGYYSSAEFFRVYIWEWHNVILPALYPDQYAAPTTTGTPASVH